MRITIVCVGSRGDVQPYAALGVGLREAGHEVSIATHTEFQDLVLSSAVSFSPVEGNPREILQTEDGRRWIESNKNSFAFFAGVIRLFRPLFDDLTRDVLEGCRNAEAIIYSPLALCAHSVAEKIKVPSCMASLQPISATTVFASPMFPQFGFGRGYNLLTYKASRQIVWQPFRSQFNQWRRDKLDLPPYPFWGPLAEMHKQNDPVLHAFSPVIVPRPRDWKSRSHITGYWFLNHRNQWQPPDNLLQFLSAGYPPVYIGFGSMSERDPIGLSQLLIRALKLAKRRGILLSGWANLPKEDLPEDVFVVDSLPHDWLFPQMAAVVHHGGAGTTAAAFHAGIPSVVIPFFSDQHFWGARVFQLGAGPKPIPRQKLTAESLAEAITYAVSKTDVRKRAEKLGEQIRNENGVQRAIEILEADLFL